MVLPAVQPYPDVQVEILDALDSLGLPYPAANETPHDLDARLPFVRALARPGTTDNLSQFVPVDLDVFGPDDTSTWALAERIHQWLTGKNPKPWPSFDRVRGDQLPAKLPWADDGNPVRFGASYTIVTRRRISYI